MKNNYLESETERVARVITKCFSVPTLEIAAQEMGITLVPSVNIFRALVVAKIAKDFDDAVLLVAKHLDTGVYDHLDNDDRVDGKIERRQLPRSR